MPLPADQGTGLGKALKIIAHPVRPTIPVWVAALGEKNVAMTAEVADGWIPMLFMPDRARSVWGASLDAGAARRDPALGPLQITVGGMLAIGEGDDVVALRDLARPMVALYVGGMGAKGRNFYNDVVRRYGFEEAAEKIQDLYLDGKKSGESARWMRVARGASPAANASPSSPGPVSPTCRSSRRRSGTSARSISSPR